MEIHRDSESTKENGSTFSATKVQPEATGTLMQYPRTPLADVRNKHNKGVSGHRGSSRKFSVDSCSSLDIANQLLTDTPRKQESKLKSRKSCFAVFNIPQDFDTCENAAAGVTLPRANEEVPDSVTTQNQILSDDSVASACGGFVTPILSSPLELMNISDSSFREDLHKTNLADLIQSYLLSSNSSSLEELSFSSPVTSQLFSPNLPPPTDYSDSNQSHLETYSSNKIISEGESNILESSFTQRFMEPVGGKKVQSGKNEIICYNESEQRGIELEHHMADSDVNILGNESVIFINNKTSEKSGSPACDITSTASFHGSVHQIDSVLECSYGNHEADMGGLSHKEHSDVAPEKITSFGGIEAPVSVDAAVPKQAAVVAEPAVPGQIGVVAEPAVSEQIAVDAEQIAVVAEPAVPGQIAVVAEPAVSEQIAVDAEQIAVVAEPAVPGQAAVVAEPAVPGQIGVVAEPAVPGQIAVVAGPAVSEQIAVDAEQIGVVAEPAVPGQIGVVAEPAVPGQIGVVAEPAVPEQIAVVAEPAVPKQIAVGAEPAVPKQIAVVAEPAVPGQIAVGAEPAVPGQIAVGAEPAVPGQIAVGAEPAVPEQIAVVAEQIAVVAEPTVPEQAAVVAEPAVPEQAAVVAEPAVPEQIAVGAEPAVPEQIAVVAVEPAVPEQVAVVAVEPAVPEQVAVVAEQIAVGVVEPGVPEQIAVVAVEPAVPEQVAVVAEQIAVGVVEPAVPEQIAVVAEQAVPEQIAVVAEQIAVVAEQIAVVAEPAVPEQISVVAEPAVPEQIAVVADLAVPEQTAVVAEPAVPEQISVVAEPAVPEQIAFVAEPAVSEHIAVVAEQIAVVAEPAVPEQTAASMATQVHTQTTVSPETTLTEQASVGVDVSTSVDTDMDISEAADGRHVFMDYPGIVDFSANGSVYKDGVLLIPDHQREITSAATNTLTIEDADVSILTDHQVELAFSATNTSTIEHTDVSILTDHQVELACSATNTSTVEYTDVSILTDHQVELAFSATNTSTIEYTDVSILTDHQVELACSATNTSTVEYTDVSILTDHQVELACSATNTSTVEYTDVSILTDHQVELACSPTNTSTVEYTDVSILTDHQVELACSATNTSTVEYTDVSILTDHQVELACSATNTSTVEYTDVSILTDHPVELACSATNTSTVEYTDVSILTDHQVELACSATNTSTVEYTDVSILIDHQVELACSATNTSTVEYTDVSILTDHHHCEFVNTSMVTDVAMDINTCHGIDVSMVTDCADMFDRSAMAMPEYLTQETMTEQTAMVDTESSMTPLKLGKQGKRFTAGEIRRQHPRIIANQLETLMASNHRLEKEVGAITHDRDRLRSVVGDARAKLATADKQLNEEKERQGGVISVIEQYHSKTVESLESCVKDKQDRLEQVEFELKEVRQTYGQKEEELKSSISELQEKCAKLEKLNLEAEQIHAEEMRKIQTQFEENNYQHAFLASQQVIRELQAEKEEIELLFEDIEHSASLQSQLQDSLHLVMTRSQQAVRDHSSIYERLLTEKKAMCHEYTCMQTDLEVAMSENRDLHEDNQNINDILQRSDENYTELKEMYHLVSQDLDKSQAQVTELHGKIEFGYTIVKDLMETKASIADELSQLQEKNRAISERLKSSEEEILNVHQQLDRERQLASATCEKYEMMIAESKASKSKLEITVESLRSTLDSWEVDRDLKEEELNACLELVAGQRAKITEMSKELKDLRQVKAITQPEREHLQELKNTNHFLEAEKQLYLEAVTDYRTRLEAEIELAASNNNLMDALKSNNAELRRSNDQLASDIQILEEELSLKTMDNDMSRMAMENLQERVESFLASLQQKCSLQIKQGSPTKGKFSASKTLSTSFQERSSFVAQVLSAAQEQHPQPHCPNTSVDNQGISELHISSWNLDFDNSSSLRADATGKPKLKQSNLHYGALHPRYGAEAEALLSPHNLSGVSFQNTATKMLTDPIQPVNISNSFVKSEMSADTSLKCPKPSARKDISKLYSRQEQNTSLPGFAKICSIPSTIDRTLVSMTKIMGDNSRSADLMNSSLNNSSLCSESESVLSKVKAVDRLFSLLLKTVDMAERAAQLTIEDLKDDFDVLKEKVKFQRCQNSDLQADLELKSAQLLAAKLDNKDLNTRVCGMTRSILNFQDQQIAIMRLEEDKAELKRDLHGAREEVTLLSGQLDEVIKKFDDVKSGQKSEGACVREIVSLKKKNHELMMKLFDDRDKNKEVGEKAMRRIKILDENWKKAEAEVSRFDELVENIRETCVTSQAQSTHPAILKVVRLIDGVAGQAEADKTPHKI